MEACTFLREIWNIIIQDNPIKHIINFCSTNKLSRSLYNDKQLWKLLVERDYPFITLNKSYREVYIDTHRSLYKHSLYLYDNYAVCNKEYVNEKIIIITVSKELASLLKTNFNYVNIIQGNIKCVSTSSLDKCVSRILSIMACVDFSKITVREGMRSSENSIEFSRGPLMA